MMLFEPAPRTRVARLARHAIDAPFTSPTPHSGHSPPLRRTYSGALAAPFGGAAAAPPRTAGRTSDPVPRSGSRTPAAAGNPGQEFRFHVLAHQPVVPTEGRRRARQRAAFRGRGRVNPGVGQPWVRRCSSVTSSAPSTTPASRHQPPPGRGERRVNRAEVENPALSTQAADPQRRLGPPGQDQPGTVRDMIGQHRQRGPALLVVQDVHVIEHQRDRRRPSTRTRYPVAERPSQGTELAGKSARRRLRSPSRWSPVPASAT